MTARPLLAAALATTLVGASASAQAPRPSRAQVAARVATIVNGYREATGAPGVSVAVIRAGRDTLVFAGYGLADLENDVPATAQTVYRIGSITKQFTSSAVMRLVEQGRVSLDSAITVYLPQLPATWKGVTVRLLLNHTSGIASYTDIGDRFVRRMRDDLPPDSIVALVRNDTLNFAIGSSYRYNNTGYVILGLLVEQMSGERYADYVRTHFIEPFGLTTTHYCDAGAIVKHRAQGYTLRPDTAPATKEVRVAVVNADYMSMAVPFSAGAMCSTVGDLATWNRALASGRVVSPASWTRMTTPEGSAARVGYGYGLSARTLDGHRMIEHSGGINGFLTDNAYLPDDSLSVTVLTNLQGGNPGPLLRTVARAALGLLPPTPPAARLAASALATYTGTYELPPPSGAGPTRRVRLLVDGTVLRLDNGPGPDVALIPYGEHRFGTAGDPMLRLTFAVEGGRATGLRWQQENVDQQWRRAPD